MHPSKIKVCHVATVSMSHFLLGLNQLIYLRREGYEVHCASAKDNFAARIVSAGFPLHPISLTRRLTPWQDLKALYQLIRLFKKERFDIVYVHTPKAALLGSLAAFLCDVPVRIYWMHGLYFRGSNGLSWRHSLAIFEYIIANLVHYCLSDNYDDLKLVQKYRFYSPDKIEHLGPGGMGVDIQKFIPSQQRRQQTRQYLGISEQGMVVGIVGRLTDEKGFREFFEAISKLKTSIDGLRAIVVGIADKKGEASYQNLIKKLGIEDRVLFTGPRFDMEQIYPAFDIFCLPSYREGKGMVLMEACACGIPCVTTNIRGCNEVILENINGFLVPPRQVEPLTEKLLLLLQNHSLRQTMGAQARQQAEQHFNEMSAFKKIDQLFHRLLESKR